MEITSTRSNANKDAHRDFDDFDQDEGLQRFREAVRSGQWRAAAILATNLDESLSRGGSLPAAWIGPRCMEREIERRSSMSASDIDRVVGGYVRTDEIQPIRIKYPTDEMMVEIQAAATEAMTSDAAFLSAMFKLRNHGQLTGETSGEIVAQVAMWQRGRLRDTIRSLEIVKTLLVRSTSSDATDTWRELVGNAMTIVNMALTCEAVTPPSLPTPPQSPPPPPSQPLPR